MEPMNTEKNQVPECGGMVKEWNRIRYYRKITRTRSGSRRKCRRRRLWWSGMAAMAFLLVLWSRETEDRARYVPEYARVNIVKLLDKSDLSEEDYKTLFMQTGLAKSGVDVLRREGRQQELLLLQDKLFAEVPIRCQVQSLVPRQERVAESGREAASLRVSADGAVRDAEAYYGEIPYVEEGDILITFNCHVLGWRNGHAALVVDDEQQKTLEASMLGSNTAVVSMGHWRRYPSFIILRLRGADRAERAEIADYAMDNLLGVPYHLTAGWGDWLYELGSSEQKEIVGTQCAHLVWYAYRQFGYDLDGDGGRIVTPRDLYESPHLEVVQVYGMPIVP